MKEMETMDKMVEDNIMLRIMKRKIECFQPKIIQIKVIEPSKFVYSFNNL